MLRQRSIHWLGPRLSENSIRRRLSPCEFAGQLQTPLSLRYDSGMSESAVGVFEIECPCCKAKLRVDPETQAVLHHEEPPKKPLIEDLHEAVQQLKGEAGRRQEAFEKSFASHLNSEKTREKKFEELLKQAIEDKSGAPPKRPFDVD